VNTMRFNPVSICVAVTLAPETVPPLASRIVPRIFPVISCARAAALSEKAHTKTHTHFNDALIEDPLSIFGCSAQFLARRFSGTPAAWAGIESDPK
jgi:hypothetical protein